MTSKQPWIRTSQPGIYVRGGLYRFRPRGTSRWEVVGSMAEAKRAKAAHELSDAPAHTVTFTDYADTWLASYSGRTANGVSPETRESYRQALAVAGEHFGQTKLTKIDPPALKRYVAALADRGLAPASVRRYFAPVRAMLATAHEDGLIPTAPNVRVVVPAKRTARPKSLTAAELGRLVERTPAEHRDLVRFLAATGCRVSEALGLRWRNLEQQAGVPVVRFERSKTDAGLAPIALPPQTARMLLARRGAAGPEALVFPNATGGELDRRGWTRRVFKPAAAAAGVPWATPHVLRHTLASRMADAGETAPRIARALRHADGGRLAAEVYVHPELVDVAAFEV